MISLKSLPIILFCCLIFFSSTSGLGIDRKSKSIDFTQTDCLPTAYSACAVRNAVFLVRQVVNDLNSAPNATVVSQILSLINAGGSEYRLGTGNSFTVTVWQLTAAGPVLAADGVFPAFVGQTVDQFLASTTTLDSPVLAERLANYGVIGGAWLDGEVYNYSSPNSVPTPRRWWVDSAFAGSTYVVTSGFDNVDSQLVGRRCIAKAFAPCATEVIVNLVGLVVKQISQTAPTALTNLFSAIGTAPQYRVRDGFSVTVARASDGVVVATSGNSTYLGKTLAQLSSSPNFADDVNTAAACGGAWVLHNWKDNPNDAEYQRQSWAVPVSVGGANFFVFSGVGTGDDQKCPPCVCPGCPPVRECPICPNVTPCDGAEVTNLKLDFTGMV